MISKELLSEVLGYKVVAYSHNGLSNGKIGEKFTLHINPKQRADKPSSCVVPQESINIYELAHKCKEWAFDKGYIIEVGVHPTIKKDRMDRYYFYKITTDRGKQLVPKFVEVIKTEEEAIFKACELILKEVSNVGINI